MATAKVENIPSVIGNLLGIDPNLIRSEEEKQQLAQAAAQAQQSQQGQQVNGPGPENGGV